MLQAQTLQDARTSETIERRIHNSEFAACGSYRNRLGALSQRLPWSLPFVLLEMESPRFYRLLPPKSYAHRSPSPR